LHPKPHGNIDLSTTLRKITFGLSGLPAWARYLMLVLALAIGFTSLHHLLWQLGWQIAILPNASPDKHGFRTEVMPSHGSLLATSRTEFWPESRGGLRRHEGSLEAFAILQVSRPGKYRFVISGKGRARVFMGRNQVYSAVLPDEPASFEVKLKAGPRLLVINLAQLSGASSLSLKLIPPGDRQPQLLQGKWLSYPDLPNIELYWLLISLSQSYVFMGLVIGIICLMAHLRKSGRLSRAIAGFGKWAKRAAYKPFWQRLVVYGLLFIILQSGFGRLGQVFGDESSYLLTSLSMTRDGDFNLLNNYQQKDYLYFCDIEIDPQVLIKDGRVPPEHGIGFPLLITLPYEALGITGLRLFLILVGLGCALMAADLCGVLGHKRRVGDMAGLLICISPTWLMHANRIFPEVAAGSLLVFGLWLIHRSARHGRLSWSRGLLCGVLVGSFPLLYLKYTLLGMALGGYCLIKRQVRGQWGFYLGLFLVLGFFALTWLRIYGGDLGVGSGGNSNDFAWQGMLARFWRPWLDRDHGLLVLQPVYGLFLLAIPALLHQWLSQGRKVLLFGVCACLAYAFMYAMFIPSPGMSWPGRFLCAVVPLMSILIAIWALQDSAHVWRRLGLLPLAGLGLWHSFKVAFYSLPVNQAAMPWYLELFSPYWADGGTDTPESGPAMLLWLLAFGLAALGAERLGGPMKR
jgi:hypothetical protein